MKKINCFVILLFVCFLVSCGAASNDAMGPMDAVSNGNFDTNEYLELKETGYINTETNNKVNLSLDSSNAAYSNLRKLINKNYRINPDSVNIEQMLNYFSYSYVNDSDEQLKSFMEISSCPWNEEHLLLSVAVKAKDFVIEDPKPNNFVFLLDTSGSMDSADKLPLMVDAFKVLIDNLGDNDRVSIMTYAGSHKIILDGGYGYDKTRISALISDLYASGSTGGANAIENAYQLAEKHFIPGGNNRVFLATDGDFNVGISNPDQLKKFISEKRQTGIYLSCLGFGYGNLNSDTMDTLAQAGNGNYYYVDTILEAQKLFVKELGGTLHTVAKDTKVQVEFDSSIVEKYRVLGYENKVLTDDEFNDNTTDAGEIGAGHTTVCLIEFKLRDVIDNSDIDSSFVNCILKYKDAMNDDVDKEIRNSNFVMTNDPSTDFLFQCAIVEFGLILRNSEYKGSANLDSLISRIDDERFKTDVYRREFIQLVYQYQQNTLED